MAINKKLIHFKNKSKFNEELANNNINDASICFIQDTQEIWTHGQLYHCASIPADQRTLAYAEYTDTSTTVAVTTKSGYFPETLTEGASIVIKFEGSISSISTLDVNGTGAKNVYYKGNSLTSGSINRYNTYLFVYDGSHYRIAGINTDTHYTAKNVVTSSSTSKSNATATNGNVRLNLIENAAVRSTHKIVGTGATTVTSDSSGNITIDTPLKTINGESIVGSGDITIEGGSSSDTNDPTITYFDILQFENTEYIDDYNNIEASGTISESEYDFYHDALEKNKLGLMWDSIYLHNLYVESFGTSWFNVYAVFYDEGYNVLKYVRVWFNLDLNVTINTGIIETGTGGSGSSSGITSVKIDGVSKTPSSGVVDLGYVNKKLTTSTSSSMTLSPNIYYRNTNTSLSSLTITLGSVSNSNILNEYFVEFTTRSSGTTVSLPSSVKWANGVTPTFENGKTYQISIVNNLGTCVKFG